MPAKRHAARVIHPWRTSGHNKPGYGTFPARPQQAPAAPQAPVDEYTDEVIDMGAMSMSRNPAVRSLFVQGISLVAPPFVVKTIPGVELSVGGVPYRVPTSWRARVAKGKTNKEVLFLIDHGDRLRVITTNAKGELRELAGIPADLQAEMRAAMFPKVAR